MILDELTEFADAVSVASAAATINVGDVVDLTVARDIGSGARAIYLVITVDTEIITGGTAGTIIFRLVSDSTATPEVDGTASQHFISKSFVTDDTALIDAQLRVGGVPVCVALPMEGVPYERYVGVQATIVTTTTTAGKINAFLTLDPSKWKALADAI